MSDRDEAVAFLKSLWTETSQPCLNCHPNCQPFQNIMRLPKEKAFALATEMANDNSNTTAFYRFADFENYYLKRMKTDEMLYQKFIALGGNPKEQLLEQIEKFDCNIEKFMEYISENYSYIEVQVWDDKIVHLHI